MISFLAELQQEAAITQRVLERVPENQLTWQPHAKFMTLGQLALHTAAIPGVIPRILADDSFQANPAALANPPQPASQAEIMQAFDDSLSKAKTFLEGLTSEKAETIWCVMLGEREIVAQPREWAVRSIMFNHLYHHRGQLSVYLRLLDIPVPAIYGGSADETPFR
jgi:uncharacterized damage-inducible protein DinB